MRKKNFFKWLFLTALLIAVTGLNAQTVYLSEGGNDGNSGADLSNAVATLGAAYALITETSGNIYVYGTINVTAEVPISGKAITIEKEATASTAVFDGGNSTRFLTYAGGENTLTLRNLTFQNGFYKNDGALNNIGGGALAVTNGNLLVEYVTFQNNKATTSLTSGGSGNQGGAVFIGGTNGASFINCEFINNESDRFGAVSIWNAGNNATVLFKNCYFSGNNSLVWGGGSAINFRNAATNVIINIINCTMTGNAIVHAGTGAVNGGGALNFPQRLYGGSAEPHSPATVNIVNTTVTGNTSNQVMEFPAGIYYRNASGQAMANFYIRNSIIAGNTNDGTHNDLGLTSIPNETPLATSPSNGYIKIENSIIGAYSTPAAAIDPSNIVASQIGTLEVKIDPKLGAFDATGKYFPLAIGSPAIGTGDGTLALVEPFDQVGNPRTVTGACNMGSVEVVEDSGTVAVTGITVAGQDGITTITKGGGTLQMIASVLPETATDKTVTWSVNDEALATIDADGLLTAKASGVVTVIATANDGSDVKGELAVTITLPPTTVWNPAANNPSDGLWTTAANWTNGLPHNISKVVFNVPDAIDCIVNAQVGGAIQLVQGDGGPGGVLHIQNGGVVNTMTTGWSAIGWNRPAKLIVDEGGVINFGQHMWIAHNAGADNTEIYLNGGIINIGSQFGMDWTGGGSVSTLYLNGGLLNLTNIHPTTSIGANSKIIIDGGLMQIKNDHATVMQAYVDAGKIVGKGGSEIVILVEEIDGVTYTKLSKADDILVTGITVTATGDATTITTDGGTLQMIATVLPEEATDKTVTWSVNDEAIATIDAEGLLTAKANGDVTVTATANDGSEVKGSLDITISGQTTTDIKVTGITVTGQDGETTITKGAGTLQMIATVIPEDATDPSVTWSVDNEAVATIDADGLLTAVFNGNVTVTATANDGSGIKGELIVTVALAANTVWNPAAYAESTGLWVEKENWTNGLPHKDSKVVFNVADVAACVLDADATIKQLVVGDNGAGDDVLRIADGGTLTTGTAWSSVAWSTDATLIVEQGGVVNFGGHFWVGTNGKATVDIYGTVNVAGMFGIAFEAAWNGSAIVSIKDNGVLNLANIHPDQSIPDGSYLDINDDGVITLKGDHLAKVVNYIDLGRISSHNRTAKPHAELVGEGDDLKTVISVKTEVTEITVTGAGDATTITTKGGTLQMNATVLPADASDATVTWSVSDETIATIDADGLLTAVTNGEVTVTATANDGSGITGILVITVTNQDTSVWEYAATKIINIYPNPATTDILYLQNAAHADVEIYSITGQIIIARSNTSQINIQDLEPGIYFVRITAEGTQQTRKLIRE
jgi:uncharacterized protein YjdB